MLMVDFDSADTRINVTEYLRFKAENTYCIWKNYAKIKMLKPAFKILQRVSPFRVLEYTSYY